MEDIVSKKKGEKKMAEFKRDTPLQRERLQVLIDAVREYLQVVEIPYGARHRKTALTFTGDRFKPTSIECRYITTKHKVDD